MDMEIQLWIANVEAGIVGELPAGWKVQPADDEVLAAFAAQDECRSGDLSLAPLPGSMEALLADAREWLIECFPDQEDEILEASEEIIRHNVERHWDGGWASFRHCMEWRPGNG